MKVQKRSSLWLTLIFLIILSACSASGEVDLNTPVPGAIDTLAAETMTARSTLAALLHTPTSPHPTNTIPITVENIPATSTTGPTRTPVPSLTPLPSATQPLIGPDGEEIPCNAAQFVADVTVPDDTVVRPGETFTKTWRIKNVGACTWTPEYSIVFVWGEMMDGVSPTPLATRIEPGKTADISIRLKAPQGGNCYQGNWMLEDPQGERFGVGYKAAEFFWVAVSVWAPGMPQLVR